MKIRFYLALAAAALVMTNCSQDEELVQVKQNAKGFTATIEGASRSDATEQGVFSWTAGDKISVYTESGFDTYVNSEADVNTFTFAPEGDAEASTPTDYAIYPAGNHKLENGTVIINLPATYAHGSTNAPMLATIEDGNTSLAFKHLGGLMRFVVNKVPVGASSFVFTTTNNIITGEHYVVNGQIWQNSEGTLGNNNSVTITFEPLTEEAQSMVFFVPLPVGTYGKYSVEIKGNNLQLEYTNTSTDVTNTIGRCTMLLMPEFTCTDAGLGKAPIAVIPVTGEDVSLSGIQSVTIGTDNATQSDVLNINYTPQEGNAILNITDDSGETTSQDSKAKIKITPQGTTPVASLNINTPTLTAELGAGKYGTVEALTANQTLIIGEGVTVETLILNGGNVELSADATIGNIIISEEKEIKINLKGKTLAFNSETSHGIDNYGTLTIKGDNGKITWKATDYEDNAVYCIVNREGATLNIEACEVAGPVFNVGDVTVGNGSKLTTNAPERAALICGDDNKDIAWTFTMTGGSIVSGTHSAAVLKNNYYGLTPKGLGKFDGVTFTGTTYYDIVLNTVNVEITDCTFTNDRIWLKANNYVSYVNGEPTRKENLCPCKWSEIFGTPITTFDALTAALSAAPTDGTHTAIVLGGNIGVTSKLEIESGMNISLHLNEYTLNGTVDDYLFESNGNLTISNGNIKSLRCAVLTKGGTLNMTKCYVTVTGNYWENAVEITGKTTAVITGGQYTATGTLYEDQNTDWYGIGIVDGAVTLNTTVNGNFNGGVTLAPEGTRPNVTITGGSYSGKKYHGLNMNGGDLTLAEDAEMTFSGNGGDIRVYTKTGKINGVDFGFTLEGQKNYTLEELRSVIAEKKASAE